MQRAWAVGPPRVRGRGGAPGEFAARLALLSPFFVLYGVLLIWPLVLLVWKSLAGGAAAYGEVVRNPLFRLAMVNTLVISALTTVCAVALGYLCAAAIWKSRRITRLAVLALVLLPFWTGVLVKNFAWAVLLQDHGVVNNLLRGLGLIRHPLPLLHDRFAVIVGMVHYVLPYAVFPIFAAMSSVDDRLERAAASLGASRLETTRLVVLPLTLPGVYAAALLVFIISTGFFITPVILGGPRDMMAANLVDYYARQLVDFRAASALAVFLIAGVSVLVAVYQCLPKEGQFGRF
jgi:putative spermidine/putrescine transport system permease protein